MVEAREGAFAVLLDAHELKTPAKKPLHVPSEALAKLIAEEWQAQADEIDPNSMPHMRLVSTALDRVAENTAETAKAFAAYVMSDLLCYRAEHPQKLVQKQADSWDPLLQWAKSRFDVSLAVTAGILPVEQPQENHARFAAAAGKSRSALLLWPIWQRFSALPYWLWRLMRPIFLRAKLMSWLFLMICIKWKTGASMKRRKRGSTR